jgi:hypothetical protein
LEIQVKQSPEGTKTLMQKIIENIKKKYVECACLIINKRADVCDIIKLDKISDMLLRVDKKINKLLMSDVIKLDKISDMLLIVDKKINKLLI